MIRLTDTPVVHAPNAPNAPNRQAGLAPNSRARQSGRKDKGERNAYQREYMRKRRAVAARGSLVAGLDEVVGRVVAREVGGP
jgi:hypothetical protein